MDCIVRRTWRCGRLRPTISPAHSRLAVTLPSPSTDVPPAGAPAPQDESPGTDVAAWVSKLKRIPAVRWVFVFAELLGGLTICYVAIAAPFKNADLEVRHILHTVSPPSGVTAMLDSVGRTSVSDTLLYVRAHRFAATKEIWQIQLQNTTSKRLEDLDVQLTGVVHVEDSGITTNSSVIQQRARQIRVVGGPEYTARVEGLDQLPPETEVKLTIWGDFTSHPDPHVKSTAGSTRVWHYAAVSGLGRVIDEHRVVLVFISGIVTLLVGFQRFHRTAGAG